jgi:hypothetical protein
MNSVLYLERRDSRAASWTAPHSAQLLIILKHNAFLFVVTAFMRLRTQIPNESGHCELKVTVELIRLSSRWPPRAGDSRQLVGLSQ